MGVELAKLVVGRCGHLDKNPYKVMVAMAAYALDSEGNRGHKPDLYTGGWMPLAVAIGMDPEAQEKKAKERVRLAVKVLVDLGYIRPVAGKARVGNRQTYRVMRTPLIKGLSTPSMGGHEDPSQGGKSTPATGDPRKTKEEDRTNYRTTPPTSQPSPKTARDESGAKGDGVVERWKDERCDHGHLVRNDTCTECAETRHLTTDTKPRPKLWLIEGETA